MKLEDLNDPNASMTGGNDLTLWAVMFGLIVIFVVAMLLVNHNSGES